MSAPVGYPSPRSTMLFDAEILSLRQETMRRLIFQGTACKNRGKVFARFLGGMM